MKPYQLAWCEIHDAPSDGPKCLRAWYVVDLMGECLFIDAEVRSLPEEPLTLTIPLLDGQTAYLKLPRRMTVEQWDQMIQILEAMKPGLVSGNLSE